MTVSFNYIPSGIKMPLFYAEVDNSQANIFTAAFNILLIGQKFSSGIAAANIPFAAGSIADVQAAVGKGSMLDRMYQKLRANTPLGEVWILPVLENGAGVAQQGTITVTGPATANGTINLYIAGQLVQVAVSNTDSATTIATAIKNAINAATDLPITATNSSGVVTWTCRWKGATGADIVVTDSYFGAAGGESLPSGVALAYAKTTAGTSNPSLTTAIANMADEQYDFIIHPFTDSTSLAALGAELNDSTGRWSYARQLYGHAYTAARDTFGNLITLGQGLTQDPHQSIFAAEQDIIQPVWEIIAATIGQAAAAVNADITRPTQTLAVGGITPPRRGYRFIQAEREALLSYRLSTFYLEGGQMHIARIVTIYNQNALGSADSSYLDADDMHHHAYILRRMRSKITSVFARCGLADDETRLAPGLKVATPKAIRGVLLGEYRDMEYAGLVENYDDFSANLIVERDPSNPNRVNVLYPPDLTNALRVFAVLYQFRLQYPAAIAA